MGGRGRKACSLKKWPQTPRVAGDRPALMNKVTNLSLRQEERRVSRGRNRSRHDIAVSADKDEGGCAAQILRHHLAIESFYWVPLLQQKGCNYQNSSEGLCLSVWIASVQFPEPPRVGTVGLTRTAKACVPSVSGAEMPALKQT